MMLEEQAKPTSEIKTILLKQSLLGLFMSEDEINSLIDRFPIQVKQHNEEIFREGDIAANLIIVLEGKIKLITKSPTFENIEMGTLRTGRSANLFSVVRGLPLQYSGSSVGQVKFISIPWKHFEPQLAQSATMLPYLNLITEEPVARAISKDLTETGCSERFRIEFLGSLECHEIDAQTWMLHQGQVPDMALMVTSGSLLSYQKPINGRMASLSPVPARTWIGWEEVIDSRALGHSFRTTGVSKVIGIKATALLRLQDEYPNDFKLYSAWAGKTKRAKNRPDDVEQREDVDTNTLFAKPKPVRKKWPLNWSYPWVAQENQMDCGPACLAMISKYYENQIPIQVWRNQIFTNREGTSLFDLAKGAEKNGLSTHGLYVEDLHDLDQSLLPYIVVRQAHYLVVYELGQTHVTIGDPSFGIRKMPLEEFYKGFEKAVLLLRPTDDFYNVEAPTVGNGHYLQLFKGYIRELLLVLACSVILVLFSLFPPILMQVILDEVVPKKDSTLLIYSIAMLGFIGVLQAGMGWLRSYYISYITSKFDFRAQSAFIRKMFSLPYSFFANRHIGDFTRRLSEMSRLREFMTGTALSTLLNIFTLAIYGTVLAFYNPTIALVTFLVAPILVGISMLFSKRLRSAYMESFASQADQESLLNDLIRGVPAIKSLTAEVASRWRLEEKMINTLKARYRFSMTSAALGSVSDIYGRLVRLSLLALSAYLAIQGEMTPGQIISVIAFTNFVIDPFFGLAQSWSGFQELKSVMTRLNDIFLAPSENLRGREDALKKVRLRGEIEFQDVWFRYGGESTDWVLRGVSFKIEAGQKIAIAGPSGSGKSTIALLMLRLFEPTQGQIFIDGRDYRDYDIEWLRQQIGMILQDSYLFNGNITENIAFGDPQPNEMRVREAAKLANAHEFVMKKPSAYGYIVTHGGFGLSGGEKQRISCARAFYANPPVLILDEATSALDGVAERDLIEGLLAASQDRTVLSIAHRYTTVRYFDQVLLMNAGKVVGFGTHSHLREHSQLYCALFGIDTKSVAL